MTFPINNSTNWEHPKEIIIIELKIQIFIQSLTLYKINAESLFVIDSEKLFIFTFRSFHHEYKSNFVLKCKILSFESKLG